MKNNQVINSIVSFIPARSGSKSIPHKNIKLLGNKPLIAWSIETSLNCGLRTIVNTDSGEYAKIAQDLGAEIMMRPYPLAQDYTSMFELLKSEIPKINPLPEYVLLLQPTTPFRKKADIKRAVDFFTNEDKFDSLIFVEKVPEKYHPSQVIIDGKMADGKKIKNRLTRRQEFSEAYTPTGSVYLFKTNNLEKGSIYGDKVYLFITEPTININTFEDFKLAEEFLKNKK